MWRDRKGGTGEVEPNPPTDLVQLIGVMVLSFAYESRAGCILGWFSTVSRSPTRVPPHAADRPWWIGVRHHAVRGGVTAGWALASEQMDLRCGPFGPNAKGARGEGASGPEVPRPACQLEDRPVHDGATRTWQERSRRYEPVVAEQAVPVTLQVVGLIHEYRPHVVTGAPVAQSDQPLGGHPQRLPWAAGPGRVAPFIDERPSAPFAGSTPDGGVASLGADP